MQIFVIADASTAAPLNERASERGAALITVLLFSVLLLAAGGALIMTTALSATNAADAIGETQAYYAGEAGTQAVMNVLRGNVAPITFRQAVSTPSLSGWLTYNSTYSRVPLTNDYNPLSGMAYNVSVADPDNTGTVIFNVTGAFANSTQTMTVGTTNQDRVVITYSAPSTNPTTINSSGTAPYGSLQITPDKPSQFNSYDIGTIYPQGITFNLTITQTSPYPSTSTSPTTVVVACTLTRVISSTASQNTVQFNIVPPDSNPTSTSNLIGGVPYDRTTNSFPLPYNTSTSITPVTITAPQPSRLIVRVVGFGPRAAEKHLQMMVSRYAFDFKANAAVTIRGADPTPSGSQMTSFSVGSSHPYGYSGYDNSGGVSLPAFVVTNDLDKSLVDSCVTGQIKGSPAPARKASLSELPIFLQTAQGARDVLTALRDMAQSQYWPVGTTGADNDRYFPAGTTPNTFGSISSPLLTFVDGDCALPPGGGAGLLVVTGVLDLRGSADFKGIILALGAGQVLRNGGGSDTTLGSIDIARFGPTGDFLQPSFDSNGSGASQLDYDSKWVDRALASAGPGVKAVSEY